MCILAGSLWGSLFLLLPAGKSRMDFQVEKGVTKVSTEDTASKVDVSLKHGTAQLGRVPDAQDLALTGCLHRAGWEGTNRCWRGSLDT